MAPIVVEPCRAAGGRCKSDFRDVAGDGVFRTVDIAQRIENELQYPGQVKVVVIRESRAIGIAK